MWKRAIVWTSVGAGLLFAGSWIAASAIYPKTLFSKGDPSGRFEARVWVDATERFPPLRLIDALTGLGVDVGVEVVELSTRRSIFRGVLTPLEDCEDDAREVKVHWAPAGLVTFVSRREERLQVPLR